MADQSQLSLLKQGVKVWNEWRCEHPLDRADLKRVNLRGTNLRGANLSHTNLMEANLSQTDLKKANLFEANMIMANLSEARLIEANLSEARLIGANLREANLSGADLRAANLNGSDLRRANLGDALLDGAKFERAIVGFTIFGSVNLSACSGLGLVEHVWPSTLGVDSIIRSKGRIPEIFLRGVGLPDAWITQIPSLAWEGIQFFSCFISYSSLDKSFAVRLHDALQAKGIRCWLDEKQLLPGHDISRELERGIYLWDKFLLCASKNSLTSRWVENEIKTTLEKEWALRKEKGTSVQKLIPLNLDGYMFSDQWDLGVLANEIRSRVAADFRDWEKPNSDFDKQVDRVIKALRADEGAREKPPQSRL